MILRMGDRISLYNQLVVYSLTNITLVRMIRINAGMGYIHAPELGEDVCFRVLYPHLLYVVARITIKNCTGE